MKEFKKFISTVSLIIFIGLPVGWFLLYGVDATFDPEIDESLNWMYDNWITKYKTEKEFRPYDVLRRKDAAEFFVLFAEKESKYLHKNDWYNCNFSDIQSVDNTTREYIIKSCELWFMKWYNWMYMPESYMTKAVVLAIIVKMMYWPQDESIVPWWDNYFKMAKELWLTNETKTLNLDRMVFKWEIALLLYRTSKYLQNPK